MTKSIFGKILDIDLSSGKIDKREIDSEFARSYIGGMGFSNKILYDEVGPGVDRLAYILQNRILPDDEQHTRQALIILRKDDYCLSVAGDN